MRPSRRLLSCFLAVAATPVGTAAQVQVRPVTTARVHAAVLAEDDGVRRGRGAIDYEPVPWTADVARDWQATVAWRRAPGGGDRTVLENDVPIEIGNSPVVPGRHYLGRSLEKPRAARAAPRPARHRRPAAGRGRRDHRDSGCRGDPRTPLTMPPFALEAIGIDVEVLEHRRVGVVAQRRPRGAASVGPHGANRQLPSGSSRWTRSIGGRIAGVRECTLRSSQIAARCGWHDRRVDGILNGMRPILASTLAALGLFLLSSCGDAAADGPVGTYALDKAAFKQQMIAAMPAETSAAEKEKAGEMFDGVDGSLELKADNTAVMSLKMPMPGTDPMNRTTPGTWKLDGNKITITTKELGKDETVTGTYAAGVITLEDERNGQKMRMTFKK